MGWYRPCCVLMGRTRSIASCFCVKSAQEQSVDLEVASAFEIAPEQASRLADAIGRKLQRTVRVSTTVDKTLIGGVVIRTADLVIDGSVRGRLAKLSEAMNS